MNCCHVVVAALLSFPLPLSAQAIWVVDAAGGAGSHFRTISAAVTRAAEGDSIVVRTGTYGPFATMKALTIVGEPGATVENAQVFATSSVSGIGAGKTMILHGLRFTTRLSSGAALLSVANCPGRVILNSVKFEAGPSSADGVRVTSCAALSIDNCKIDLPARITSSRVVAVSTAFARIRTLNSIIAQSSDIRLTSCTAVGGLSRGLSSLAAVTCSDSRLVLRGAGSSYAAGPGLTRTAAVTGDSRSSLTFDPKLVALSNPSDAGFGTRVTRRLPWLVSSGGKLAGVVDARVGGPQGQPFLLYFALPALPITVPGWGDLWLDTKVFALIAAGIQTNVEFVDFKRTVPNVIGLRGLALSYQALAGRSVIEVSNPATVVLHQK